MPSIILVKNSTIFEAFVQFRKFSILKMLPLLRAIWVGFSVLLITFVLLYLIPFSEKFFWIRFGMLSIVIGGVLLFFFMMTMLLVAEHSQAQQTDNT